MTRIRRDRRTKIAPFANYQTAPIRDPEIMMQVLELNRANSGANIGLLMGMHRLSRKVFKDRLETKIRCWAPYAFFRQTRPNMLADTFPELLDGGIAPSCDSIAESSRFCVDTAATDTVTEGGLRQATFMLFAAMLEWGRARGLRSIATVTDVRMERILRRAGWPLDRLGAPRRLGVTVAVAGLLPIETAALDAIRANAGLVAPVLATRH